MDASELAAWWGAVIATLVLVWDLFKWLRSGPRLDLRVEWRREVPRRGEEHYGNALRWTLTIEVANVGDAPTTLTRLEVWHHPTLLSRFMRRGSKPYFLEQPRSLPYLLGPGEVWRGVVPIYDPNRRQRSLLANLFGTRRCRVFHSAGRPQWILLRLP